MRTTPRSALWSGALGLLAVVSLGFLFQPALKADVVVLQNGAVITGHILQQDANGVLLQMEYSTCRYPLALVKDVKPEAAAAPQFSNNGQVIPDWAQIVTLLANNGWATEIKQVPATVINYGKLNHVPFVSFRCASGGYEIIIFGDLNRTAAIEIGAMNHLKSDNQARINCVNFVCSVLANAAASQTELLALTQPQMAVPVPAATPPATPAAVATSAVKPAAAPANVYPRTYDRTAGTYGAHRR